MSTAPKRPRKPNPEREAIPLDQLTGAGNFSGFDALFRVEPEDYSFPGVPKGGLQLVPPTHGRLTSPVESVPPIDSTSGTESPDIAKLNTFISQTPANFQKLTSESIPHTDSIGGVDSVSHIESAPPSLRALEDVSVSRTVSKPKPRRAILAQDGHSLAEQAVYAALWDAGTVESPESRTITIGLGKLSRLARISENNCRLNIRSLAQKLALCETKAEISRDCVGKTYRIYNYTAILERRRKAGLEWVIRTKGVAFVNRLGQPISAPPIDAISPAKSVSRGILKQEGSPLLIRYPLIGSLLGITKERYCNII